MDENLPIKLLVLLAVHYSNSTQKTDEYFPKIFLFFAFRLLRDNPLNKLSKVPPVIFQIHRRKEQAYIKKDYEALLGFWL